MDKLVVLAYDLAAVLIILMTIAYSAQRGFATGVVRLIGQLAAFLARHTCPDGARKSFIISFLRRRLQHF